MEKCIRTFKTPSLFLNLGDHLYEQMTRVISLLNSEVTSIPGTRNMVSAATFKDILDLKLDWELI